MTRKNIILLGALFLLAFILRGYDVSYPGFLWADEQAHVPAAVNYWSMGQFEPDNWDHPPLRHIILYGFMRTFGNNPYGWRMRNVLFGAAAAVLTAMFAFVVSGSRRIAALAGILLATDPLHIVLSRYTYDEIYGSAFFLAAIVLFLMQKGRSRRLLGLSAVLMGCALATKWYFVPGWLLLWGLALREGTDSRHGKDALFISSVYLLIPIMVYLLSYSFWFGRGYSFDEFIEFTANAYYAQQSYKLQSFDPSLFFLSHTSAAEWFLKPVIVGQGTFLGPDRGEFILYMNNLPIWILTIPAMVVAAVLSVRKRSLVVAYPVLFFVTAYALFLFVDRPVFIYSSAPLLPFAFTAIAYSLSELVGKTRAGAVCYAVVTVLLLTWSMYLYPFATAKKVPLAPYRYLLNAGNLSIH